MMFKQAIRTQRAAEEARWTSPGQDDEGGSGSLRRRRPDPTSHQPTIQDPNSDEHVPDSESDSSTGNGTASQAHRVSRALLRLLIINTLKDRPLTDPLASTVQSHHPHTSRPPQHRRRLSTLLRPRKSAGWFRVLVVLPRRF